MVIREATKEDLSAIIHMSTQSLGVADGLRSEEYWMWKHTRNPFGESPVLLAWEEDQLVGLRAFMRWRFSYQGKAFQAYRAVDTATHPQHQGKGIFTKLTIKLLDQVKEGEPSVIFNTPNKKSEAGYLKMSWTVLGKTHLKVRVHPYYFLKNRFRNKNTSKAMEPCEFPESLDTLLQGWKQHMSDLITTDYSLAYLRWRYQHMPVFPYGFGFKQDASGMAAIIYRLKKSERVKELRICEVFFMGKASKLVKSLINEVTNAHEPDVITVLTDQKGILDRVLPGGFFKAEALGLTITTRIVNSEPLHQLIQNQENSYFSTGTLELF